MQFPYTGIIKVGDRILDPQHNLCQSNSIRGKSGFTNCKTCIALGGKQVSERGRTDDGDAMHNLPDKLTMASMRIALYRLDTKLDDVVFNNVSSDTMLNSEISS